MLGLGGLVAQAVFWAALGIGWFMDDISSRAAVIFIILWAAGWGAAPYVPQGDYLFISFVALLDIVLLFTVFREVVV